jgi:hypothetical protein
MQERIFRSGFTLKYLDSEIEDEYIKERDSNLNKLHNKILISHFLMSIFVMILNSCYILEFFNLKAFQLVVITSYLTSFILGIFIIISMKIKNGKTVKFMQYVIFYFIFLIFINFRYTVFRLLNIHKLIFYLFIQLEFIIRMFWVVLRIQNFVECFYLNLISLCTIWLVYPLVYPAEYFNDAMVNYAIYSTIFFMTVCVGYIIEKQQKISYYFHSMSEKKANWLTNVFENMNEGFLSIKGNKISYINPYIIKQYEYTRNKENYKQENQLNSKNNNNNYTSNICRIFPSQKSLNKTEGKDYLI